MAYRLYRCWRWWPLPTYRYWPTAYRWPPLVAGPLPGVLGAGGALLPGR